MRLYHGTNYSSAMNIVKNGIDLRCSKQFLDFGPGFYTTPSYEHAARTAIRTTAKYNKMHRTQEEAYIVELIYNPSRGLKLETRSFPRHSEKWGEFVLYNRLTSNVLTTYDIIDHNQDARYDVCCGEIADGNIANIAYQVNNGMLKLEDVDYHDFLKDNGQVFPLQYSFHTSTAISCINSMTCGKIKNVQKYLKSTGRR